MNRKWLQVGPDTGFSKWFQTRYLKQLKEYIRITTNKKVVLMIGRKMILNREMKIIKKWKLQL